MDILPEIAGRRSIRRFAPEPLDPASIKRILESARRAPSAKNRQAWRFIVVTEPDTREKIQQACFGQEYVGQAPAIFVLCTTNVEYEMPNGIHSYPVDLGVAAGFMLLQAEHERLGTCPVTYFEEREVKAVLSVPYKMRVVMLVCVGKPDEDPPLTQRMPLERVVGYEHW